MPSEADDRAALADLAEAWGTRVSDLAFLGREVSGRSITTGWRLTVVDPHDVASEHTVYLDDAVEQAGTADSPGALLVDGDGRVRRAWRFPDDPALPALPALIVPDATRVILRRLGVAAELTGLRIAAYRPGKRAVIQVSTTGGDLFVKVLPPARLPDVVLRHEAWQRAGLPSPPVLATSPQGLLVLGAVRGRSASSALGEIDPDRFAGLIADLRARIAATPTGCDARESPATRIGWYARRLASVAPEVAAEAAAVRAIVRVLRAHPAPITPVTVHGDLHLGQLLVDENDPHAITGILDVDTSGTGDPADDDAALWANLAVGAMRGDPGAARLAATVHARWADDRDAGLPARAAAGACALLLGHALSGHLDPGDAVRIAARLARHPDENPLTATSSPSHAAPGS